MPGATAHGGAPAAHLLFVRWRPKRTILPAQPPLGKADFQMRLTPAAVEGSAGEQSPLQARAAFLQNWQWESVVRINRGVRERGRAQHGKNSESFATVEKDWEERRALEATLGEMDYLRSCTGRAPFLFFNGNTFAD